MIRRMCDVHEEIVSTASRLLLMASLRSLVSSFARLELTSDVHPRCLTSLLMSDSESIIESAQCTTALNDGQHRVASQELSDVRQWVSNLLTISIGKLKDRFEGTDLVTSHINETKTHQVLVLMSKSHLAVHSLLLLPLCLDSFVKSSLLQTLRELQI